MDSEMFTRVFQGAYVSSVNAGKDIKRCRADRHTDR